MPVRVEGKAYRRTVRLASLFGLWMAALAERELKLDVANLRMLRFSDHE